MTTKQFFKRFVWGKFFPAVALLIVGILTACMYPSFGGNKSAGYAYEFLAAALSLAAGCTAIAYYFLGNTENIASMLSGVGGLSVAVYLFVPPFVKWGVVPIAIGVVLILYALSMCFEGVALRKEKRGLSIARIVCSAVVAAGGALSCARLFAFTSQDWLFAGLALIFAVLCELVFLVIGGLFREEEVLKFRRVKPSAPAEKDEEDKEEAPQPHRRGAHRR